ncbi:hypothetical protein FT643_07315 [Ketobacter sp. MCCC 1A13808]|uniref:hypothetical protein n=1 Tax=Ketobacter sp. MCCC 1A13808 TaxID=2602738 RepID=UPI000F2787BC|nr:hypothetical protein [Ketobacter sp. MCCC 1A13808]MVF11954.1 hypothetical protein [Ketobacter sp. MCCC 1A13808]RLP52899.1 MAG: hypothetical protein D6160_18580 [Ketobacter sp.]
MATPEKKHVELAASKESVMDAYDKLMEASSHFRKAAEAAGIDLKQDAVDNLAKGREKAGELGKQADTLMKEKPLATLSVAFVFGFILSQFFSRK